MSIADAVASASAYLAEHDEHGNESCREGPAEVTAPVGPRLAARRRRSPWK